jgi:hypothetical protein
MRLFITLILLFIKVVGYCQHSKEIRPFFDDHKIFSFQDHHLGIPNLSKYNNSWNFLIDLLNTKSLTVKQIHDSLVKGGTDPKALRILKSWSKLSVDSVSVQQIDSFIYMEIGLNNTYNEDNSDFWGTIYIKVAFEAKENKKAKVLKSIQYLSIKDDSKTYVFIDPVIIASFPGGEDSLHKYILKEITSKITVKNGDKIQNSKIFIQFTIDEAGLAKEFVVKRSSGIKSIDDQIIRVMENMPRWKPAEENGKPTKSSFVLPIQICVK